MAPSPPSPRKLLGVAPSPPPSQKLPIALAAIVALIILKFASFHGSKFSLVSSVPVPVSVDEVDEELDLDIDIDDSDQRPFFWEKADRQSCYAVENICHLLIPPRDDTQDDAAANNKWFYFQTKSREGNSTEHIQPTIQLRNECDWGGCGGSDPKVYFNVSSDPKPTMTQLRENKLTCSISSTTNHVIIQSAFNDMMGEFYVRSLPGLVHVMQDYPPKDDVQFYIHFVGKGHKLLDAHKLFLNGTKDFASLFHDGDVSKEKQRHRCECYRRLVFCGYSPKLNNIPDAPHIIGISWRPQPENEKNLTLFPSSEGIFYAKAACTWLKPPEELKTEDCKEFANTRIQILGSLKENNRNLPKEVTAYRAKLIGDMLKVASRLSNITVSHFDHRDWKVIGLSQRTSRRRWLNLNDVLMHCNKRYIPLHIACVQVNVESLPSDFVSVETNKQLSAVDEQFVLHQSLDALVGIHGASLTQGVLLPDYSAILEILPWIPEKSYFGRGMWGEWTRTKIQPTPLGLIYHNTELQHFGYQLERDSVPLCQNVSNDVMHDFSSDQDHSAREKNETELDYCLTTVNGNSFRWDKRDFTVRLDMVDKFVDTVYHSRIHSNDTVEEDGLESCNILRSRGETNDMVMYNVWCQDEDGKEQVQHYYWEHN